MIKDDKDEQGHKELTEPKTEQPEPKKRGVKKSATTKPTEPESVPQPSSKPQKVEAPEAAKSEAVADPVSDPAPTKKQSSGFAIRLPAFLAKLLT